MPAATMPQRMTPRRPAPAAPLLSLGLILALAACSPTGPSIAASSPSQATPTATTAPTAAATLAPSPTPTPIAGTGFCNPSSLSARITAWSAGAGHRTADVTLTNNGTSECTIHALAKPQLRGGNGAVLIDGQPPTSTSVLTLGASSSVSTLVSDANYCGPAPTAPVTVAFVFPANEGTVVAAPLNATDVSGVPPCMGPGQPGDIEMHPFAP
jgi:hypothetical protein